MERTKFTVKPQKPMHKHICIDPQAQMMALDLMSGDAFLVVNKKVLAAYGPSLTIFLSHLIDQFKYYHMNNQLQSDGSFFLRHQDIQNKTGMTEYTLRKSKNELRDKGLITTIMKGVPQKEFYFLHLDKLVQEYRRINPIESKGLILSKPKEYNNNLIEQEPNIINKNPQNHSDSDWILDLFPQEWKNDKSFQESIKDFIQHRKEKGSKLTKVAASRLAKKLTNHPIQIATQALELSMENGWQGVFPESVSKGSAKKQSRSKIGTRNMECHDKEVVFSTGEIYKGETE